MEKQKKDEKSKNITELPQYKFKIVKMEENKGYDGNNDYEGD
jgi:hypothetical protein